MQIKQHFGNDIFGASVTVIVIKIISNISLHGMSYTMLHSILHHTFMENIDIDEF